MGTRFGGGHQGMHARHGVAEPRAPRASACYHMYMYMYVCGELESHAAPAPAGAERGEPSTTEC